MFNCCLKRRLILERILKDFENDRDSKEVNLERGQNSKGFKRLLNLMTGRGKTGNRRG